jgi:glycerol-3-phosphate O-acyltransferase/dihydroxyacetone phosphate acyltransferase
MWLLPVFSGLCSLAVRVFYRFEVRGPQPPARGPLLLVANHPNSLVDPALVSAGAGRPVRFLAKAPLFSHPWVGWLVRASGAIPVYRRSDDPALMERNQEMFAAVLGALAEGSAIGVFPEGITHSEPSLGRLKTGSARIALAHAESQDEPLAIVPTGLVLRAKGSFRSEAKIIHGQPIVWEDLLARGERDFDAVQELTLRIEEGLRQVTVNLESWEDQPLVEAAQAIWAAELESDPQASDWLPGIQTSATILRQMRKEASSETTALVREVTVHYRRLERLGLKPADLRVDVDLRSALQWTAKRVLWLGPQAALLAAGGFLLFLVPYQLTALLVRIGRPPDTQRSTHQILVGTVVYSLWTLLLSVVVGLAAGSGWGVLALVLLPSIGMAGMSIRERWRGYWSDMRRFLLLRSRLQLVRHLQQRQRLLAASLDGLARDWQRRLNQGRLGQ